MIKLYKNQYHKAEPMQNQNLQRNPLKIIDGHVHIVGNGLEGSGCGLKLHGVKKLLAAFMLKQLGITHNPMQQGFDAFYVEHLIRLIRESSLDAAVILAQENVYNERGEAMADIGSFYVPNHYVLSLAKQHAEFIPAVSIHPARKDAFDELEFCLANGAAMLKLLPNCHNVDCNDRRYTRFWERMAEAKLPLLAHTGGENTVPVVRPELADPRRLELPLQCGVTVIAAHCATRSGLFDRDWFNEFAEMTMRYPNLFGDNSAFNLPMRGWPLRHVLRELLSTRIVHGSDFPVPILGVWAWLRRYISWKTYRQWQKHPNVLERDYQLKKAMGFSAETFTRINHFLRIVEK